MNECKTFYKNVFLSNPMHSRFDQRFGYDLRLIERHVDTATANVKRMYFASTIIAKNVGLRRLVL